VKARPQAARCPSQPVRSRARARAAQCLPERLSRSTGLRSSSSTGISPQSCSAITLAIACRGLWGEQHSGVAVMMSLTCMVQSSFADFERVVHREPIMNQTEETAAGAPVPLVRSELT